MRKIILLFLLCLLVLAPVFSAPIDIGDLEKTMTSFATELALSLPFNSAMGLNWADAHIKNFPHFGVGFSIGFTTMEVESFNKLVDYFSPALPSWVLGFGGFPLPGYAVEGRIGGFYLPFDVGLKFGILPIQPKNFDFEKLEYFLIGGDIRYAVLEEKELVPCISIGIGFSYLKGGLGMNAGDDTSIEYPSVDMATMTPTTETLTLGAPKLSLDWATSSLDFKAQISKTFVIFTPYLGFGASSGWSEAEYSVKTKIQDSGGNIDKLKQVMKDFGLDNFSLDGFGASSGVKNGWSYRLYGGFAFTAALLRIELTGLYNIRDNNYGATIGMRVQI